MLISLGANVNIENARGITPLCKAVVQKHVAAARALLEAGASLHPLGMKTYVPLHVAAAAGTLECVKLLLDYGADVSVRMDKLNDTALWQAASQGHLEIVVELLNSGAHPKAKTKHTAAELARDENTVTFRTPLHGAIHHKNDTRAVEILRVLVDAGADVNAPLSDKKYSLLMFAVVQKRMELVRVLVESFGARVDEKSTEGQTALNVAVDGSFAEVRKIK